MNSSTRRPGLIAAVCAAVGAFVGAALAIVLLTDVSADAEVVVESAGPVEQPAEVAPSLASVGVTEVPVTVAPLQPGSALPAAIEDSAAVGWTKPALGGRYIDESFGTAITRMTSADGTRFDRNTYSRRNPENADGTLFFTYHGDATYTVRSVADGALVRTLGIHPDAEPQWHPDDPHRIRHIAGPNSSVGELRLFEVDVLDGVSSTIADLTDRLQSVFPTAAYLKDRAEGAPSIDGNRWAWIVYDTNETAIAIVSYDLATDEVLGLMPLDVSRSDTLDWVSASPTGAYVMAAWWDGTWVFDADLANPRQLHDDAEHSDMAIGRNGNDVYVFIDFSAGANGGWVMAVDLVTGQATRLIDLYDNANTSIHFSGKAYDAPGWVVASTYNCKEPGAWSCEKVFLLDIETADVVPIAHTHNCGDSYWTETHAATNRDLTRVWFNSDGGSCGIDAEVYRIDVSDELIAGAR